MVGALTGKGLVNQASTDQVFQPVQLSKDLVIDLIDRCRSTPDLNAFFKQVAGCRSEGGDTFRIAVVFKLFCRGVQRHRQVPAKVSADSPASAIPADQIDLRKNGGQLTAICRIFEDTADLVTGQVRSQHLDTIEGKRGDQRDQGESHRIEHRQPKELAAYTKTNVKHVETLLPTVAA
ncbi:hypothetical protein HYN24_09470 [Dechloromonas sp. HYN0024]|nr:hypothetical protein HYN24_09470 [Dechloromonas sp. HYN0024]